MSKSLSDVELVVDAKLILDNIALGENMFVIEKTMHWTHFNMLYV